MLMYILSCHNLYALLIADLIWRTLHCESRDGSIHLFEDGCGMELDPPFASSGIYELLSV